MKNNNYDIILKIEKIIEMQSDTRRAEFSGIVSGVLSGDCANNKDIVLLADIYTAARDAVRTEKAKSSGTDGARRIAEKLVKHGAADAVQRFNKSFPTADGRYIFLDGYIAIRTAENFDLPESSEMGTYDKIFCDIASGTAGRDALPLPELKYLTEYIKTQKTAAKIGAEFNGIMNRKTPVIWWSFGDDLPTVNAEYLKDVLTAVGDHAAIKPGASLLSGLYVAGDTADAILMPVKTNKKKTTTAA